MNMIASTHVEATCDVLLPERFSALQGYVRTWALETETQRNICRHQQSMESIAAFKDAMLAHMDEVIAFVNASPLDQLNEEQATLLKMLLSLAEIAPAVECYNQQSVPDGFDPRRFPAEEDFSMKPIF